MPKGKVVAVIPARMASNRLPGKPLRSLLGVPMIERVYRRAVACEGLSHVVVATEDGEIEDFCRASGIPVERTAKHVSGTDRVAELALRMEGDIFVNLQGDEPLLDPAQVKSLLSVFDRHPAATVATVVAPLLAESRADPNKAKVVVASDHRALYFSRAAIPYDRDRRGFPAWQHVGIYAFTKAALEAFTRHGESPLERIERLEQLRFLEAGIPIYVGITDVVTRSVDTEEDVAAVEALLATASR